MKIKLAMFASFWMLVGFAAGYADTRLAVPTAPKPIAVQILTANSIKKEVARSFYARQYMRATLAARAVYRRNHCSTALAELTGRVAVDYGVSPRVLAGLVFVESSGNPRAVSPDHKSIGLTQINMRVWKWYSRNELLDPERNLEAGAQILAQYVHKYGLVEGLHHYNGMGDLTGEYAKKVLTSAGLS